MSKSIVTRTAVSFLIVLVCGGLLYSSFSSEGETMNAQENTGNYVSVNGLTMYYEIHGSGQPIVLLHGGLGGVVEFTQLLPLLAETHQVIAVELQAHGHTADIDRPLSFELMADDVAALIQVLELENTDVLGYSLGGSVALQLAIRHPEVVRKLVLISTPYSRSGIHPEFLAGMEAMNAEAAETMLETPMYQYYASVAPNLDDWPTLVGKVGELLGQDYDWSTDVAAIRVPTLIVIGDSDMLSPTHAVELFTLFGGGVAGGFAPPLNSQLAVLPNTNHFTILSRTELLLPIVVPFLDAPLIE
jgi:pimeloyl-ACP methyl ester carboxylesterase